MNAPQSDCQTGLTDLPRDQSAICNLKSAIWLHRFAALLVIATFALLALGGTVTSHGYGLAVPDWPTTYEHNMFLFPPSMWVGGIFWEHTHRLMGSLVGFLTIALAVWLWLTQKHRPWLRWFGVAMLLMVIVQGVMGGLRVTQDPTSPVLAIGLATVHGITAQLFLCGAVLAAAATGRFWLKRAKRGSWSINKPCAALLLILLIQLTLGSAMRHTGSGLAIPDFPSAYGQVIPPMTAQGIEAAADRVLPADADVEAYPQPWQVGVHFAHRVWAGVVIAATMFVIAKIAPANERSISFIVMAIVAVLLVQLGLGASVIWTGRHPQMATAHQMMGAVLMALVTWLTVRVSIVGVPGAPVQEPNCEPRLNMQGAGA